MQNNEEYSNTDILNLFYIHGECGRIVNRTCRVFNSRYPTLSPMTRGKFVRIEERFKLNGSVKTTRNDQKPVTENEDNAINVLAYFHAYPRSSIPAANRDLGISSSSIHRILKSHRMHPYAEAVLQELRPGDHLRRTEFCEFMWLNIQEDGNFLSRIIWTDESKFSRGGIVNRRNKHFWATENPHVFREGHFQTNFSFNVLCIIMDNLVVHEIYEGNLNSERYVQLLRVVVRNFVAQLPPDTRRSCWYQLDGAPAHSTRDVYDQLTEMFQDRWIGPNGPWTWPPRSPDLTPADFHLWGRIKAQVYDTPVESEEDLLGRIRTAFRHLDPNEIRRATTDEMNHRILQCLGQSGGHIEHLL